MAMNTVINTNVMALTAHRNLGAVGNRQNKANQRLSSGKKINSAADDAAGLAISEKMKAQIKGLDMASKNSEDAISLIQTAEGSLSEVNNMLTRVRELTVQAGNDTNQQQDRVKIAEEVAQLLTEIDSISSRTAFNEKNLNDGSFQNGHFQIGSNVGQKLDLSIGNMSVMGIGADAVMEAFGLEKTVDLNTKATQGGVITSEGKASSVEYVLSDVQFLKNGQNGNASAADKKLTDGTVTMKYKEHGVDKTVNVKIDLSSQKTEANGKLSKEKLAAVVADQLNKSELKDKFKFTADTAGKLTIATAKNGGEVTFDVTATNLSFAIGNLAEGAGEGTAAVGQGNPANNGTKVDGNHHELDLDKLSEGESITIGGRKFTKVDAAKVADTTNGFSTGGELRDLLAQAGISANVAGGTKVTLKSVGQKSELAGNYKVNAKAVSDKGKDFSNLIEGIDNALRSVTTQRAQLGSNQNRLEYTINSLNLSSENLTAAKSRIEDTDMAKEMMNLTSANVLQQAATTILAQANQAPKNITQLLG